MSKITTSTSTITSNILTTNQCDKKNTKSSNSTFSKFSVFFSGTKNTPSQQSSTSSTTKPSVSSFSGPSSSREKYKIYKNLEGNSNVKIDRTLLSGIKKIQGGFAIESKGSYSTFKESSNITIGSSTLKKDFKQSFHPSASSFSSRPSASKEKSRMYSSFEEAAKKEKGIKIEKKGGATNVTISGVSGLHIGKTTIQTFTPQKR
ncbi:hypothetical protein [Candidatus Arsenophonus triatominarum]|uniref:hypothetical protein n=1 Tax=Candidatus Arsenophonus triatominarum TaxID=57911 RepID=UPI0007C518CA|nr:hypothetical protein [Candidatus Arsenophonus triatominarum]